MQFWKCSVGNTEQIILNMKKWSQYVLKFEFYHGGDDNDDDDAFWLV
jgi:hypothetical protein